MKINNNSLQTQVWEGKPTELKNKENKECANAQVEKESASAGLANGNGDVTESITLPKSSDVKPAVAIPEKEVVANGC